jgi:hypothetical protein
MVENEPPYALSVHKLSEAVLTIGRKQVAHAVRIWRAPWKGGAFQWVQVPPGKSLQPEAAGAVMEVLFEFN